MIIRKTTKICLKMEDDIAEFEAAKQRRGADLRTSFQDKSNAFDKFHSPVPHKLKNEYSIEMDFPKDRSRGLVTPQMFQATNLDQFEEQSPANELSNEYIHGLIQNIGKVNQSQE